MDDKMMWTIMVNRVRLMETRMTVLRAEATGTTKCIYYEVNHFFPMFDKNKHICDSKCPKTKQDGKQMSRITKN